MNHIDFYVVLNIFYEGNALSLPVYDSLYHAKKPS